MRRILIPALVATLVTAIAPVTRADEGAQISLSPRWDAISLAGDPVTSKPDGSGVIVSTGFAIKLTIACFGENVCDPARPARIEALRNGAWVTWSSGTMQSIDSLPRNSTSKRAATLRYRPVLLAHEGLSEVIGPEYTISFLPGSSVKLSGSAYVPASKASGYRPSFRSSGTITVRLDPAAAGRTVELHDVGVAGWPLIATTKTDRRGRATIRGDFSSVTTMRITLVPTPSRAGWSGFAFAAVPPPI